MSNDNAIIPTNPNQLARQDFGGSSLATSAITDALVAKETASIQARWIMAMRSPRNLDTVRQDILREMRRPGFAEAAIYSLPRGGKDITGLSIRFAEVAVRCMRNIQPEAVTFHEDARSRMIKCTVTDYESNVTWSKDITIAKTVERKQLKRGQVPHGERLNSYGEVVYLVDGTDDEIAIKEASAISKTLRTLILRCIPGHLQDEAMDIGLAVLKDKAAKDPDGERVRALDAMDSIGLSVADVALVLGHGTERMSPADITRLRGIYRAVQEGQTTIAEVLDEARDAAAAKAKAKQDTPQNATAAPQANAEQAPAVEKPAASSARSKGTAALKDKIAATTVPKDPPAGAPASKFDEAANAARAKDAARSEPPPLTLVNPSADDYEMRMCPDCREPIEVLKTAPASTQCSVCRQV